MKQDPHFHREAQKYDQPVVSREYILSALQKKQTPQTFKSLCKLFSYSNESQIFGLKQRLRAMERDGQITFNKFKQYAVAPARQVLTGTVIGHRDGYGFFKQDAGGKDLFINAFEMQRVFHGDVIEAIVDNKTDKKGRKEIRVLSVVEPRKTPIVGRVFKQHSSNKIGAIVKPEDSRIQQEIVIPVDKMMSARHGQIVAVKITERPSKRKNAVGEIIEVLGDFQAPGMEIEIALREHDLPHQFSAEVLAELAQWTNEVDDDSMLERKDIRHLPLITIDGEDARDFDDAVYCETKKSGGWRLWVAIADVSYYVRPGSKLDDEAINRGNSVYFPSQVIPMLPEKLSNGLCSLNPDVNRLCFVCEMTISQQGKLTGSTFYPAVMKSHARLTYTKVAAILAGDEALRDEYCQLVPEMERLNDMYQALVVARKQRGAIEFETTESRFIFNEHKKIESIEAVVRNDAHKIIEECMILANVATAKFIEKHKVPGLFRVHDKPNEEKYHNFIRYLAELGITFPKKDAPEPRDYGDILAKVAGRADEELIQTMLLRSMKQAVYQAENIGHFGLALPAYSHFTSPIRRYPDLVVHRVIKAILQGQANSKANDGCYSYTEQAVTELGEHCSLTERRADEATRDVADWLKCEFMQDHVGMEFTGVISTVTNFGFFVRLTQLHIEGLVHISSLGRDFYQYDELRMRLVGEKTNQRFHVGDELQVKVAAVNLDEKKIDLILAGEQENSVKSSGKGKRVKPRISKNSKEVVSAVNVNKEKKSANEKKRKKKTEKVVKSKVKKRTSRKKRPGKNERLKAKQS